MGKLNKSMDAETFAAAAEAQKPLIEPAGADKQRLGAMTVDRWRELVGQLVDLGVVDKSKAPTPNECFIGPNEN
jgi:NitT/TauT family transport system substrate-binding protein